MARKKKIGSTVCPYCPNTEITDPKLVLIHYPKGVQNPYADITCEACQKDYTISMNWKDAYVFDRKGCPVKGFSFSRGSKISDCEIVSFLKNFEDHMEEFLSDIDEENEERI